MARTKNLMNTASRFSLFLNSKVCSNGEFVCIIGCRERHGNGASKKDDVAVNEPLLSKRNKANLLRSRLDLDDRLALYQRSSNANGCGNA